jgi:hypothetical protein
LEFDARGGTSRSIVREYRNGLYAEGLINEHEKDAQSRSTGRRIVEFNKDGRMNVLDKMNTGASPFMAVSRTSHPLVVPHGVPSLGPAPLLRPLDTFADLSSVLRSFFLAELFLHRLTVRNSAFPSVID